MAASGFTPISLYYSTTASAVPTSGNLANGELGLNIADMKLYAKNSAGTVTLLASSGGAAGTVSSVAVSGGTTGLTTSGGPITTSGTITLAGTLATTNGGTGLTSFTSGGVVYASSTSALATGTALVFDGANLGLSVTPSAWGSGLKAIQIGPQSSLNSGDTAFTAATRLSTNAYSEASYVFKRIGSGFATSYYQQSGAHFWETAASSTAGSTISFTQAMTLDASGNLGIGTTSPVGRFSVAGGESNFTSLSTVSGTSRVNIGADATNAFVRSYDSSGGLIFGTINATPIKIFTNGGEVARFDSSGRFGIGTSSPSYRLELGSTGNVQFFGSTNGIDANFGMVFSTNTVTLQNTGGSGVIAFATNSSERARISSAGGFSVGTATDPGAGLIADVNGNVRKVPQSGSSKTSSYTLATTDIGEYILLGASGAIVIPDATFAAGDVITIFNNTASTATITCSITTAYIAGTFTDKATMTLAAAGVATVLFITSTLCVVSGNVT